MVETEHFPRSVAPTHPQLYAACYTRCIPLAGGWEEAEAAASGHDQPPTQACSVAAGLLKDRSDTAPGGGAGWKVEGERSMDSAAAAEMAPQGLVVTSCVPL